MRVELLHANLSHGMSVCAGWGGGASDSIIPMVDTVEGGGVDIWSLSRSTYMQSGAVFYYCLYQTHVLITENVPSSSVFVVFLFSFLFAISFIFFNTHRLLKLMLDYRPLSNPSSHASACLTNILQCHLYLRVIVSSVV